jgi:hypothetical protein
MKTSNTQRNQPFSRLVLMLNLAMLPAAAVAGNQPAGTVFTYQG